MTLNDLVYATIKVNKLCLNYEKLEGKNARLRDENARLRDELNSLLQPWERHEDWDCEIDDENHCDEDEDDDEYDPNCD